MCRVHPLDWCQRLCSSLSWRDSAEMRRRRKRRRMEVVVVEEGEHWSRGVPPTMHHGRQYVT